jgi:hypothetical protein
MGLFASDWEQLHKNISRQYELIALRNFESGLSPDGADVFGIITEIVKTYVPNLNDNEAIDFVKNEYKCFKNFKALDAITRSLRQMNPDIQGSGVSEIFEAIKNRFHDPKREHEYFLFFIISKIIELQSLSISRGSYLIEISRGRIPKPSRFIRFLQMWKQTARYNMAKDRNKG